MHQPPPATKIISTRILSEILGIFFLYLISVTFFMIPIVLLSQVRGQGLPMDKSLMLIPFVIPLSQFWAVPIVMLLTVVTVFSRMNAAREIIALQTSGISAIRVMVPALIIGLIMSLYAVVMYELSTSWGMRQTRQIFLSASQDILYTQLKNPGKSITFDQLTLSVVSVDGQFLREPMITGKGRDGSSISITAQEAVIEVGVWEELKPRGDERNALENLYLPEDYKDGAVKITFSEVRSGVQGVNVLIPERLTVIVPLSETPIFNSGENRAATHVPLWELPKLVDEKTDIIRQVRSDMCLDAARLLILGDFGDYKDEKWSRSHKSIGSCENEIRRARLQPHYRGALSFSCFCFALVGAPLAVWKGRYGALQLTATALLPLLVIYYPVSMWLLSAIKDGTVGPEVMWVPNGVLAVLGIWLLRRAA